MPGSLLAGLKIYHVTAKLIFSVFHRRAEIPANRVSPAKRASPPRVIDPLMELNKNCLSRDGRKFYRISLVIFLRFFFSLNIVHIHISDVSLRFASCCENGCKLPCIKSNLFSVIYFDVWCNARTQFKLEDGQVDHQI